MASDQLTVPGRIRAAGAAISMFSVTLYGQTRILFAIGDLGVQLARSIGEPLVVVTVVPAPWPTSSMAKVDDEYAEWAVNKGAGAVSEARTFLADNATDIVFEAGFVSGRSVSQALLLAADHHCATVLVLGSSSHGGRGQITIASSADTLLHSAEIPVAGCPSGRRRPRSPGTHRCRRWWSHPDWRGRRRTRRWPKPWPARRSPRRTRRRYGIASLKC